MPSRGWKSAQLAVIVCARYKARSSSSVKVDTDMERSGAEAHRYIAFPMESCCRIGVCDGWTVWLGLHSRCEHASTLALGALSPAVRQRGLEAHLFQSTWSYGYVTSMHKRLHALQYLLRFPKKVLLQAGCQRLAENVARPTKPF